MATPDLILPPGETRKKPCPAVPTGYHILDMAQACYPSLPIATGLISSPEQSLWMELPSGFLITTKTRRKQGNTFHILKEENRQPRILYTWKIFSSNESETDIFRGRKTKRIFHQQICFNGTKEVFSDVNEMITARNLGRQN